MIYWSNDPVCHVSRDDDGRLSIFGNIIPAAAVGIARSSQMSSPY
jgi:hypothetical protein